MDESLNRGMCLGVENLRLRELYQLLPERAITATRESVPMKPTKRAVSSDISSSEEWGMTAIRAYTPFGGGIQVWP